MLNEEQKQCIEKMDTNEIITFLKDDYILWDLDYIDDKKFKKSVYKIRKGLLEELLKRLDKQIYS